MPGKDGGKAKPLKAVRDKAVVLREKPSKQLKRPLLNLRPIAVTRPTPEPKQPQAKKEAKDYDESDLAFLAKKKEVRVQQDSKVCATFAVGAGSFAHATQPPQNKKNQQEERALKALREKAAKGAIGGAGLKKSGKK